MKLFFRMERSALYYKQTLVLEEALRMNGSRNAGCTKKWRENSNEIPPPWPLIAKHTHTHSSSLAQPEQREPFMN